MGVEAAVACFEESDRGGAWCALGVEWLCVEAAAVGVERDQAFADAHAAQVVEGLTVAAE
jgi:hypothetical protein